MTDYQNEYPPDDWEPCLSCGCRDAVANMVGVQLSPEETAHMCIACFEKAFGD